ncbi:MAG: type II toxin-antitoxin system VapC family toxin [Actinomycetota bacterium]
MLVVDASVLAPVVADGGAGGRRLRRRLGGEVIAGPDLVRIEVSSVLRRQASTGRLTTERADAALNDLLSFPLRVFPTGPLLRRAWELRENVTTYDGCYVALAEGLEAVLLTADIRLANAPGPRCEIELL